MKKVYLAAPLFTLAERDFNTKLVEELKRRDPKGLIELLVPQDFCKNEMDNREIFLRCYGHLLRSDLVLAVLDGADADSGTCWEVGCAFGQGKPVIGLRTDFRGSGDTGGFNAMLKHSCKHIVIAENMNLLADVVCHQISYHLW